MSSTTISAQQKRPLLPCVPPELLDGILRCDPDSARTLRLVSHRLRQNTEHFLHLNKNAIFTWGNRVSPLADLLHQDLANCNTWFGSQPDRVLIQFHLSLPHTIRSLGIPPQDCPNRILLSHQMDAYNSRIENENLKRVWNHIRRQIRNSDPFARELPAETATAEVIRAWMLDRSNLSSLKGIPKLNLKERNLTCMPMELGRASGVESLDLSHNQLITLPERVFARVDNFVGLPNFIYLRMLQLNYNHLTFLPAAAFSELVTLETLTLANNRLASLPQRLFQKQGELGSLDLHINQLTSLPGGIFQNLGKLRFLDLRGNQLTSLPEGVFETMTALRELYLYSNPHLLHFYNPLPEVNNLECRGRLREFFNYPCTSPFAALYQLAAGDKPLDEVRDAFSLLPSTLKNLLFGKVWVEAGRPRSRDPHWGEHHTFDHMPHFHRALKGVVKESFDALRPNQRNEVYGHVYHLAITQGVDVDSGVPNWGEVHAFDNILRLIDALMQQRGAGRP